MRELLFEKQDIDLRMFDDGGAADGGTAIDTGETTGEDASEGIVYGIQDGGIPADAGQETAAAAGTEPTAQDMNAEFETLIAKGGKYADIFNSRVSDIVQRRIGDSKQTQSRLDKLQPVLAALQTKYGAADEEAILAAIEEDESFYEEAAVNAGMTVEQYKRVAKLERDNNILRQQQEQRTAQLGAQQTQAKWFAEEQALQQQFPDFSLQAELQRNPAFAQQLKRGLSVTEAYQLTHFNDLMTGAQQQAAHTAQQRAAVQARQNAARPTENGAAARSAQRVRSDPAALTPEDFEEISRRVARGEKISF